MKLNQVSLAFGLLVIAFVANAAPNISELDIYGYKLNQQIQTNQLRRAVGGPFNSIVTWEDDKKGVTLTLDSSSKVVAIRFGGLMTNVEAVATSLVWGKRIRALGGSIYEEKRSDSGFPIFQRWTLTNSSYYAHISLENRGRETVFDLLYYQKYPETNSLRPIHGAFGINLGERMKDAVLRTLKLEILPNGKPADGVGFFTPTNAYYPPLASYTVAYTAVGHVVFRIDADATNKTSRIQAEKEFGMLSNALSEKYGDVRTDKLLDSWSCEWRNGCRTVSLTLAGENEAYIFLRYVDRELEEVDQREREGLKNSKIETRDKTGL